MKTAIIIKYGYWWRYEVGTWRILEFGELPTTLLNLEKQEGMDNETN